MLRTFLLALVVVLLIFLLVFVAALLVGLGFLGIGWVFTRISPLSQYEATLVALGAGALLVLTLIRILEEARGFETKRYEINEEEEGEEEEEYEPPYHPTRRLGRRRLRR